MQTPQQFATAAETAVALTTAAYDQLPLDPATLLTDTNPAHVAHCLSLMLAGLMHCMPEHQARALLRDWATTAQKGHRDNTP